MSKSYKDIPIGIWAVQKISHCFGSNIRLNRPFAYKSSVLLLTYIAFMCYHLARKPLSVVKTVLHRNCSDLIIPKDLKIAANETTWCDYPPFDGPDSAALLGYLDSAFLFSYGLAMFASGFIAERLSLRYFLTFGMLMSGITIYLFGLAKPYDIHSIWYFVIVQAAAGVFQSTGWPTVVTILSRWFGKSKRGLIFGIWVSQASIGNILGTLIAAHYVETDWSMSFIVPGLVIGIFGFVVFLFLVDSPEIVGCQERTAVAVAVHRRDAYSQIKHGGNGELGFAFDLEDSELLLGELEVSQGSVTHSSKHEAIGFMCALRIPGVIEFSLCLFFSKLVSYTFMFWLPMYIQSSTTLGAALSADLSTLFDIGGIIGPIIAGMLSDYSGMSACTCSGMLILTVPMVLVYKMYGTVSLQLNVVLLFIVGTLVHGPNSLIATSVSAELGQHSSLGGNSKALATVTAIIDGTGSVGAAVGPLIAGIICGSGWENVFYMLMTSDVLALLFLLRLVGNEVERRKRNSHIY